LATQNFEGVTAAAICEIARHSLEVARKEFPKAGHYADFDQMLTEVPMDALLIETPAHLHAEFASKALARNIHVLSDIPTVNSVEEGNLLWAAHLKSKAFYMTGANPNMSGWIEAALDLKRRGLFGEPYYIEAAYLHDCRSLWEITPWRKPKAGPEERLPIQYCTHSLGPALKLIDEDLEWVSCFDTGSHVTGEPGVHDAMTAIFRTKSNIVVHLLTSFCHNSPIGYQHNYRFFTDKGAFERTLAYPTFKSAERAAQQRTLFYSKELYGYKNWIELPIDGTRPEYADKKDSGHGGMDYAMMDVFFKAVRTGGPSPISLREGLRMTLPGVYAAASSRKGGELTRIVYPWS
jgi:predicted dehydrogenase